MQQPNFFFWIWPTKSYYFLGLYSKYTYSIKILHPFLHYFDHISQSVHRCLIFSHKWAVSNSRWMLLLFVIFISVDAEWNSLVHWMSKSVIIGLFRSHNFDWNHKCLSISYNFVLISTSHIHHLTWTFWKAWFEQMMCWIPNPSMYIFIYRVYMFLFYMCTKWCNDTYILEIIS